jgi:DhnA family fructose-bisphosphate aldolase class Ia
MEEKDFLEKIESIKKSGAYGMAVGRNVWNSENPDKICNKINELFI